MAKVKTEDIPPTQKIQKTMKKEPKLKKTVTGPPRKKGRPVKRKIIEVTVSDSDDDFKETPPSKKTKYKSMEPINIKTEVVS